MDAFELSQVIKAHQQAGQLYHELMRADTLSIGLLSSPLVNPTRSSPTLRTRSTTLCRVMG
jgi:hypothetical protein